MTRHAAGLLLAGLAACCAVSGVFLGWRVAGQAAELPRTEHATATMTATGASYFSPTRLTEVTGADIEVTDTITGISSTGSPSIDIWDVDRSVYDTTNRQRLEPASRTLVFDDKTAELINCCGESIDGNGLIRETGIAGYAFPVGTQKQTYDVFDTVLDRPEPVTYSGTDIVARIPAYRFTETITAANAGFTPLSPVDPQDYSVRRVYWVDPETGMLLKISEDEDLYLASATTGATITHLFDADLSTTPASVARLAAEDARDRARIALVRDVRVALSGVACGLAVAAGWLLAGRRLLSTGRRLFTRRRPFSPGAQ